MSSVYKFENNLLLGKGREYVKKLDTPYDLVEFRKVRISRALKESYYALKLQLLQIKTHWMFLENNVLRRVKSVFPKLNNANLLYLRCQYNTDYVTDSDQHSLLMFV